MSINVKKGIYIFSIFIVIIIQNVTPIHSVDSFSRPNESMPFSNISFQRIAANFNITVISHLDYVRDVFYNYLKYDFSPGSLIFFAMFILLLADIIIDIRRK